MAGAADAALTASMGWVRPQFHPRSRHQRVLGGRHAHRHRVRDGRLTLGRCSDRGLRTGRCPSAPSSLLSHHLNACCLLSTGALLRACGRLCTVQVASFAIGRLGELQHWVGELGEVAEGGVG